MTAAPPDHSDLFYLRWLDMCTRLSVDPFDLLRVAYSESGCRASAHNPNGHASGLIQFMPDTLLGLGWTNGHEAFRLLSAAEQVPWVERYMRRYGPWCRSDALCYVAVFLPALGPKVAEMGDEFVLCGHRGPLAWAYAANRVLDRNADGSITVADLSQQLAHQCVGARWDAIVWRMRQAMGLEPMVMAEPPPTQPELPQLLTPITDSRVPPRPSTPADQPTIAPQPILHADPALYFLERDPDDPDDAA